MSLEQRKRLRLRELNYSEHNVYFLTLCCRDRKHLLGEIRKSPVGDGGGGGGPGGGRGAGGGGGAVGGVGGGGWA